MKQMFGFQIAFYCLMTTYDYVCDISIKKKNCNSFKWKTGKMEMSKFKIIEQ